MKFITQSLTVLFAAVFAFALNAAEAAKESAPAEKPLYVLENSKLKLELSEESRAFDRIIYKGHKHEKNGSPIAVENAEIFALLGSKWTWENFRVKENSPESLTIVYDVNTPDAPGAGSAWRHDLQLAFDVRRQAPGQCPPHRLSHR